jgi:hypothetical protein
VREATYREHPLHGPGWYWDVYDVTDPSNGSYRIMSANLEDDETSAFIDGVAAVGDRYPYLDSNGRARLPYVLYHASRTGQLWDAFFGAEIVDGTLQAGVHYSHLAHAMRAAGHPQRGIIGGRIVSSAVGTGPGARHEAATDPAFVVMVEADPEFEGTPVTFQWGPGADIGAMSEAIQQYERRVASFAGIDGSDFVRMSGDPRSGYALLISRDGKRLASKQFEPVLQWSDTQLAELVAVLVNGNDKTQRGIAEDGYGVSYQALPLSADERRGVREEVDWLLEKGFIDQQLAQERLYRAGIIRRPEDT